MNDDENTAGESVSIDRSALHKSLRILVLVTASLAALIGVCATGVFDWHIQKMLADYSAKRPSIIAGTDNSPSYFSEDYFRARQRFI